VKVNTICACGATSIFFDHCGILTTVLSNATISTNPGEPSNIFRFLRTQLETTLGKPYSRGKLTHRLPNLFYIHQLLQTWPQPSGFSKVFDFAAKVKSPDRL
jgi:hypothetical protein